MPGIGEFPFQSEPPAQQQNPGDKDARRGPYSRSCMRTNAIGPLAFPQSLTAVFSTRLVTALIVTGTILILSGAAEASTFKVGSFTKSTAGAPASQTVTHGLGTTPKVIIFWTNGKTNESFSAN